MLGEKPRRRDAVPKGRLERPGIQEPLGSLDDGAGKLERLDLLIDRILDHGLGLGRPGGDDGPQFLAPVGDVTSPTMLSDIPGRQLGIGGNRSRLGVPVTLR